MMTLVTLLSVALAATATAVAWRVVKDDRRRSAARVAALAAEIHGATSADLPSTDTGPAWSLGAFAVVGALVVTAAGAAIYQILPLETAAVVGGASPAATAVAVPLELVALHHEQVDDRLTVRGTLHNPPGGPAIDHLMAIVMLFNAQGAFLTSGRAPIDRSTLEPGGTCGFAITIPGAADVGRYRVSFKADDRVVAHVDKRE